MFTIVIIRTKEPSFRESGEWIEVGGDRLVIAVVRLPPPCIELSAVYHRATLGPGGGSGSTLQRTRTKARPPMGTNFKLEISRLSVELHCLIRSVKPS